MYLHSVCAILLILTTRKCLGLCVGFHKDGTRVDSYSGLTTISIRVIIDLSVFEHRKVLLASVHLYPSIEMGNAGMKIVAASEIHKIVPVLTLSQLALKKKLLFISFLSIFYIIIEKGEGQNE